MTAPAVDVVRLSKSYGRVKALDDISFSAETGGVTALLGLNGAGKSTLFQVLTGLFAADAGIIRIFGVDFSTSPSRALARMGIVFQAPVVDLDLTVRQNLRFHAGLHGLRGRRADQAIALALDRFGLASVTGRRVRELSGGTRRKVEIARALVTHPPLLLLDEPSTGLDTQSRRDLVRDLASLAREDGTAIVWSTHLVAEVEAAAKVVVLHRGRVAAAAAPQVLRGGDAASTLEEAFLALTRAPGEDAAG